MIEGDNTDPAPPWAPVGWREWRVITGFAQLDTTSIDAFVRWRDAQSDDPPLCVRGSE